MGFSACVICLGEVFIRGAIPCYVFFHIFLLRIIECVICLGCVFDIGAIS